MAAEWIGVSKVIQVYSMVDTCKELVEAEGAANPLFRLSYEGQGKTSRGIVAKGRSLRCKRYHRELIETRYLYAEIMDF